MPINEHWYFAPEFKPLSIKGQREIDRVFAFPVEVESAILTSENSLRLNYLEVPLLLQYRFTNRIYLSAGPQFSFLLSGTYITEATLNDASRFSFEKDVEENLNTLDISFPVEVGYALSTARNGKGVDIRLRYTPGFREVFSETVNTSSRNETFQLILSFPFIESTKEAKN